MFNTLKYYKFWFIISGLILIFGIVSLSVFGLNLGIDFKGGTVTELKFKDAINPASLKSAADSSGINSITVQSSGDKQFIIKTENLEKEKFDLFMAEIKKSAGEYEQSRFESIGPSVGAELKTKAIYQLLLVSLGIVIYIAYAFRKVPKPATSWRFGWAAVIALLHDLLFVLGFFSILGHYKGIEIDSLFVTAMLTVLGFSVHDTIVVFDRIRENLKTHSAMGIEEVVNYSINQTIVRSLNTSLTVLFVLLSLLLFGGETIRYFILALFVGIIIGTYSSIFIASPILVLWYRFKKR